jgi:hypothetical protein
MLQSRRNILTVLGVLAGFNAAGQLVPLFAQQHPTPPPPQPKPSPNAPQNQNAPMGLDGPQLTPQQRQGDINRQLSAALRAEVDKLCEMANELKEDMLRANPSETLSLSFVKKAQAIEKLAKQIKDQAKG